MSGELTCDALSVQEGPVFSTGVAPVSSNEADLRYGDPQPLLYTPDLWPVESSATSSTSLQPRMHGPMTPASGEGLLPVRAESPEAGAEFLAPVSEVSPVQEKCV